MSKIRKGGCLCGAVSYRISGTEGMFIRCHCSDCRRISGGGHLPQLVVQRAAVTVQGPVQTYRWPSDSGNEVEVGFCPTCGCALYKATTMMPERMAITVGTLEDSTDLTDPRVVHAEGRMAWD